MNLLFKLTQYSLLLYFNNFLKEFGFEVIYRPLLAAELTSKMILRSPELGEFTYMFALIGLAQTV